MIVSGVWQGVIFLLLVPPLSRGLGHHFYLLPQAPHPLYHCIKTVIAGSSKLCKDLMYSWKLWMRLLLFFQEHNRYTRWKLACNHANEVNTYWHHSSSLSTLVDNHTCNHLLDYGIQMHSYMAYLDIHPHLRIKENESKIIGFGVTQWWSQDALLPVRCWMIK